MSADSSRHLWMAAYDIADPKRLRRVAKACEDTGRRIQQSVFLCHTASTGRARLRERVKTIMHPASDRLFLLPICRRCRDQIEQHGLPTRLPGAAGPMII